MQVVGKLDRSNAKPDRDASIRDLMEISIWLVVDWKERDTISFQSITLIIIGVCSPPPLPINSDASLLVTNYKQL